MSRFIYHSLLGFVTVYFSTFLLRAQPLQLGQDIDGVAALNLNGISVSLSSDGNCIAVGARNYNGSGGARSGHVRVFEWDGSNWQQVGSDIDGEAGNDNSGHSVSLSANGSRVAIGAPGNDDNGNTSGHTRIFDWDGSNWQQVGSDINGEMGGDQSGFFVSLSSDGSRVAIGAPGNDGINGSNSGHVRIFEWNGSSWLQLGSDIDGEGTDDKSGEAISFSTDGDRVAIGAASNSGNGSISGHVRVFDWNGSNWQQLGSDIDGEAANDNSGWSVSLSSDGGRVAIGAILNHGINGSNSGHVRIYEWNGSSWQQLGSDIDGEASDDRSGGSVSLSSDGNMVAIGAKENGGNGSESGHVRVFEWVGSSWQQHGPDIDGESAGDESGAAVSLSSDGSILAIGAPANSDNGVFSGHVRVFDMTNIALPVEWVSFEGHFEAGKTTLSWSTATELNNEGFIVERSADGSVWINLDFVDGHGTSDIGHHYAYVDRSPLPLLGYYRLKQVDFDGKYEYSNTIVVSSQGSGQKILIYPNPFGHQLTVRGAAGGTYELYAINGQTVSKGVIDRNGELVLPDLTEHLYFIHVKTPEGVFVKQRLIRK